MAAPLGSGRATAPVLVTGAPRSGTTWLARSLAAGGSATLPGREPMNPRGGQFALGGTLHSWVRLEEPTPRQVRLLQRCYAGREPRTFSRYGSRQWAALLPGARVVVKDPFALLSVPAVVRATGARPVVVYRHAGAVLSSYRRMGWSADIDEVRALQGRPAPAAPLGDVAAMVEFWTYLHEQVLAWLPQVPGTLLVSHAELVAAGPAGVAAVRERLGMPARERLGMPARGRAGTPAGPALPAAGPDHGPVTPRQGRLHQFDRRPEEVADGWRSRVTPEEALLLDEGTATTWHALESCRTSLR